MVEPASIPQKYLCPITQDIMEEPVVAADGHTYERAAIMHWFEHNNISPVTGKNLKHKNLVENRRLASQISKFNEKNPSVDSLEDKTSFSLEKTLENKRAYILKLRTTIIYLTDIQEDLSRHLLNCKISNTVGNSASITGTGMLFTPLALVGVATIVAGSLTSIGTTVTQYFIEKSQLKRMKKVLMEEEKARVRYEVSQMKTQYLMGVLSFGIKSYQIGSRIWKIMKHTQLFQALRAADISLVSAKSVLGIGGWSSAVAACKATKFLKASALGAGLSAIDIVVTWAVKNPTLEEFKMQIDNKEKTIEREIKELEEFENALA